MVFALQSYLFLQYLQNFSATFFDIDVKKNEKSRTWDFSISPYALHFSCLWRCFTLFVRTLHCWRRVQ